jgi:hypothetical protein
MYKNLVQINIYFSLPWVQKSNIPNNENLFSRLVLRKVFGMGSYLQNRFADN